MLFYPDNMKRFFISFAIVSLASVCVLSDAADQRFVFTKNSRVLIIAPHPDDETLAAGGLIQSAVKAAANVKIVYLTHGDYNEIASIFFQKRPLLTKADFIKSGQIRKKEAISAMSVLGLKEQNLIFLGYPDFGTLNIWRSHWGETKPFRSFITRINKVPYVDDFSYGRPYRGDNIVRDFEKILLLFQPTHVFVTAPFDLNSDHRAAYLYFQVALLNLNDKIEKPSVFGYLVHAQRWPTPKQYKPDAKLDPPGSMLSDDDFKWLSYSLTPQQVELKKEALLRYGSQAAYSKNFMLSFARMNEVYIDLPYEELKNSPPASSGNQKTMNEPDSDEVKYWVQNDELWMDIRATSPLDELGALNIEVFSYRHDTEFSSMPKLNLRLLGDHILASDSRKVISGSGIQYDLQKKSILVRVPMKLLRSPDYIFISAQTLKYNISLDFGSWKVLKVNKT